MSADSELEHQAAIALAGLADLNLFVRIKDRKAFLTGTVDSAAEKREAERVIREVPGVQEVINQVTIDRTGYESASHFAHTPEEDVMDELELEDVDLGEQDEAEPSFTGRPGTADITEEYDMDPIFFPPTDPVEHDSDRRNQGMEVRGGWALTSTSEGRKADNDPAQFQRSDYELQEDVIIALRNDASTQDLDLKVVVHGGIVRLRGTVQSLDDVENAEAVAADVDGILEVREELEIEEPYLREA
jgi:osmotically-inducible protein OsmY